MDPNLFDDQETFNPSRFLTPHKPVGSWDGKVNSDFTIPFGFGRRICPGMHVALQMTFIAMARCVPGMNTITTLPTLMLLIHIFLVRGRIFWAFDVLPAVEGSRIDSTKTLSRGITREPESFQFRMRAQRGTYYRV